MNVRSLTRAAHSASFFEVQEAAGSGRTVVDFCIPTNSYFPTPAMFDQLSAALPELLTYYPSDAAATTRRLSDLLGLHPQTVAMGNGSTELITWIDHLLVTQSIAVPIPTFGRWTDQPFETGKRVDLYPLREADGFALDLADYARFIRERGSRAAVICQPNNPDGGIVARDQVIAFLDELSDLDLVVVDESFIDFVDDAEARSVVDVAPLRSNVIVLKSLGKNFGLHGVRFGYLVANPALARRVGEALPKWNLNSLAEAVVGMLGQHRDAYRHSLALAARDRRAMAERLRTFGSLSVFETSTNFVLVKLPDHWSGPELRDFLLAEHGVYVRECGNKLGLTSQFLRLVVRSTPDVDRLLGGLDDYRRSVGRRAA